MSDAPKFKTFRDLKSIPSLKIDTPKSDEAKDTSTSTSSTPSISRLPRTSSSTRTPRLSSTTSTSSLSKKTDVAPVRDFQKVPNSVTREFLAQGLFKGKSKQVWDYFWSVSGGAITPTRMVKKSRKEIKQGSGIGSMVTVDLAIEHLESVGLIKKVTQKGSLSGNYYEVFTPEEASTSTSSISSTSSSTSSSSDIQKVVHLDIPESSISSTTQTQQNIDTYTAPNTLLKTYKSDDEAFAVFNEIFQNLSRKLHGKNLKDLPQTAKVLAAELERVDAIKPITDIDAFLAEHLRRAWARTETKKGSGKIKDTVGKAKVEFKLERELATLRELIEIDGLETVLASIDTYDFTEEQKEALREGLKGN